MIGTWWASARSWIRRIFSTVFGPQDPALTAGSFAIRATGRPPMVPMPVTTPSAPSPSCSQLASRPSSESEPGSSSRATRSRTGSFCCSATFLRWRSGPPSSAASRAALTSVTTSSTGSDVGFLIGSRVLFGRLVSGVVLRLRVDHIRPRLAIERLPLRLDVDHLRACLDLGRLIGVVLVLDPLAGQRIELLGLLECVTGLAGAMLRDCGGQLPAELLGVGQDLVAAPKQVPDHSLDVLAPLRAVLHDPPCLGLGGLDRLASFLLSLLLGAPGVRIGRCPSLVGVLLRCAAGLRRLHARHVDGPPCLVLGLGADLLGALLGLRQDRARPLADPLELTLHDVGPGLVPGAGFQPVGETGEELLHLMLVVSPASGGKGGVPDPVEARLVDSHT